MAGFSGLRPPVFLIVSVLSTKFVEDAATFDDPPDEELPAEEEDIFEPLLLYPPELPIFISFTIDVVVMQETADDEAVPEESPMDTGDCTL